MSVSYSFKGRIPNEDIIDYYYNNNVDCFISTSATEGVPVSIMEAMGAGVPIIATNVGGVSELINGNGVLLSDNPDTEEIAKALESIIGLDLKERESLRKQSRRMWEEYFDSEKNAREFVESLGNLYGDISNLILITNGYPYGGEKSFIKQEIKELVRKYRVTIIAITEKKHSENERATFLKSFYEECNITTQNGKSSEVKVYECEMKWDFMATIAYIPKYFCDKIISSEKREIVRDGKIEIAKLWNSIKYYAYAERFYKWLNDNKILGSEEGIYYTFWYLYTTLSLCLHKDKHRNYKIITRAHGYDLFNERVKKTFLQPFRQFMNSRIDGIFFISQQGKEYYKRNWPNIMPEALNVSYLGASGKQVLSNNSTDNKFKIVSCSNVIPLKRIDRIIDALKIINERHSGLNICWIHFGDGEQMKEIEDYAREKLKEKV